VGVCRRVVAFVPPVSPSVDRFDRLYRRLGRPTYRRESIPKRLVRRDGIGDRSVDRDRVRSPGIGGNRSDPRPKHNDKNR